MATSSRSGARKSSGRAATSSQPEPAPEPASNDQPAPEPADQPPAAEEPDEKPAGEDSSAEDPAAALKRRMRTTQHLVATRPDDLTDEQRMNLVGAPAGALPGPRTLSSPTSPTRAGEAYVTAESDGHVAWIARHTTQPSTIRVWIKGQRVRKDMHDALSSLAAPAAKDAPVLTAEQYAQLAPYL